MFKGTGPKHLMEVMIYQMMCYESFKFSPKFTYDNAMNNKYGLVYKTFER